MPSENSSDHSGTTTAGGNSAPQVFVLACKVDSKRLESDRPQPQFRVEGMLREGLVRLLTEMMAMVGMMMTNKKKRSNAFNLVLNTPLIIKTNWGESSRTHPCPLKPVLN